MYHSETVCTSCFIQPRSVQREGHTGVRIGDHVTLDLGISSSHTQNTYLGYPAARKPECVCTSLLHHDQHSAEQHQGEGGTEPQWRKLEIHSLMGSTGLKCRHSILQGGGRVSFSARGRDILVALQINIRFQYIIELQGVVYVKLDQTSNYPTCLRIPTLRASSHLYI